MLPEIEFRLTHLVSFTYIPKTLFEGMSHLLKCNDSGSGEVQYILNISRKVTYTS